MKCITKQSYSSSTMVWHTTAEQLKPNKKQKKKEKLEKSNNMCITTKKLDCRESRTWDTHIYFICTNFYKAHYAI